MKASKSDELARIEDLLGEDFTSLSEARKALRSETGVAPGKDSYTVRELSSRKNRTVDAFITDVKGRSDEIDLLKREPEFWAAEIYGHGTYQLFGSMEQLAAKLNTYKGLKEENPREALRNIKVIRVKGRNGVQEYRRQKQLDVEEQWRTRRLKGKLDRQRQRRQEKLIQRQAATIKKLKAKLREKK
jgi:hypothetical protein